MDYLKYHEFTYVMDNHVAITVSYYTVFNDSHSKSKSFRYVRSVVFKFKKGKYLLKHQTSSTSTTTTTSTTSYVPPRRGRRKRDASDGSETIFHATKTTGGTSERTTWSSTAPFDDPG